ncbi:MAG: 16S rRNA (uracil(1498)-N(3))-methyltransferase [Deltaproteobacteria bacterium]|nr:16S rRNA (uracil(1498)-N(3))-methyltransferase [Deltaproteobacteria bacterium]MCB9478294.1 16S rRNA (uracil(1498)-N(3))-methyltransferase [Deltaproteobacteria bacterium]MCB9487154.1 16S rRNA (uracil(1498)-N(3))-methyltransferase [Deltaproteobacteria bacterium]
MTRHLVEMIPPVGRTIRLPPRETRHLRRVLRMRPGDEIVVFDGRGRFAKAVLEPHPEGGLAARIAEKAHEAPLADNRPELHLLLALTRGERMETVVEKSVELDVTGLWVFQAERSQREMAKNTEQRLRRHLESAGKQSGLDRLPTLRLCDNFDEALDAAGDCRHKLRFAARGGQLLEALEPGDAAVIIGPEGGLTDDEQTRADEHGFLPITLGRLVLRADTASIVAATLLNDRLGRFTSPKE